MILSLWYLALQLGPFLGPHLGYSLWQLALVTRFGNSLWQLALGTGFGNTVWEHLASAHTPLGGRLRSVAGPVIQATGKSTFEDGLRSGGSGLDFK
jgi:hypothetical protein